MESPITRGFFGKRDRPDPSRVPPGQYVTHDFPVLSAGPTPHVPTETWTLSIVGDVEEEATYSWDELLALPHETVTRDIHCVTKWSKLDTAWTGISLDTLLEPAGPSGEFLSISSYDGYTTNLPLEDVLDGKAWIAFAYDDEPLEAEHGGPARLLVPHLYFWKSAKYVAGLRLLDHDEQGFWERNGYHDRGDPWLEQRYQGD